MHSKYNPRTATLSQELTEYKSDKTFDSKTNDSLAFWRTHQENYPILSQVARRLFSYQATSVPSERLFSSAGYCIWDRRTSLNPDKIDMMMVINQFVKNQVSLSNNSE